VRGWIALSLALAAAGCTASTTVQSIAPAGYIPDAAARTADLNWDRAEAITVKMNEYDYIPSEMTFRTGRPYRLHIENTGSKAHTFSSVPFFKAIAAKSLKIGSDTTERPYIQELEIPASQSADLQFVAVTPGVYPLVCNEPLHEIFGMTGRIRVE